MNPALTCTIFYTHKYKQVIPDHHGDDQMGQFEQIVNQVGEENAKAAYFKGEVEKIAMPAA